MLHKVTLPAPVLAGLAIMVAALSVQAEPSASPQPTSTALALPAIANGPFQPTWESLETYQTPEWFRDAKFGIWAHWGPQCEPENGDWYARKMYCSTQIDEKTGEDKGPAPDYTFHLEHFGHPSKVGFKDVIHQWKAEKFDPDKLLAFYKENGARYFMALANHHDNFDLFDSKYQPWNSVAIGPKRDLIGAWASAARKNGLRFGVSVHASRAWSWYEPAQGADKTGPLAGVPYDGKLTKADGKGQWWEGLDPQDLYAQNHAPGKKLVWSWNAAEGSSTPDAAYMEKFYKRTKQLWDDYKPDQVYFDDSVLPFSGVTDELGLKLLAHFYNSSIAAHGTNEAVINNKQLTEAQRKAMVYDIERGKAAGILPQPWQTDTCIGSWHYDRRIFDKHGYKSAASVIRMLADIVSKNGNLMLSVPLQRDGTPDEQEVQVVREIGDWLRVNGEAIYATRPWKIYGEGPSTIDQGEKGHFGGLKDVGSKPYTAEDVRFTTSKDGKTLYAICLDVPTAAVSLKSLAGHGVRSVSLVGSDEKLTWKAADDALVIEPAKTWPSASAVAFKIALAD